VKKPIVRHHWFAWLLFFALGGGMWYLRYRAALPAPYDTWLTQYAPHAVIALHVIIVLTAFRDTVFQGILSLIIPFYSFFYIFLVSDAFYLRAMTAGVLVGTGLDAAVFFQHKANTTITVVNEWIANGGGKTERIHK
jgi:hypothetical protein